MQAQRSVSEYEITTDARRLDIDVIHRFLAQDSYWSRGVPRGVVERAVQHSLCFGVYLRSAQVGFGRVVTDKATFALLADVFILPEHRGKGLAKWLMQCIVGHEDLQGLRRFLLLTSDAHGLYRQFGFRDIGDAQRFMEVLRPDVDQMPA